MKKLVVKPAVESELAKFLHARVIGQDAAINSVVEQYTKMLANMNDSTKPLSTILFLGPTGTGKTRLVEAFCEYCFNENSSEQDKNKPLKISCGEFQSDHEIAKLIGAPAGYLGHGETKPFFHRGRIEDRMDKRGCKLNVILFDEIEKAGKALMNLLLGVLDRAELTDNKGTQINFTRTFIFMTSNLGVSEMTKSAEPSLGFVAAAAKPAMNTTQIAIESARRFFSPEQYNRLDEVVTFDALTEEQISKIIDIEMKSVEARSKVSIDLTPEAKSNILAVGYDIRYGARNIKRAIDKMVVRPMASLLACRSLRPGNSLSVQYGPEGLEFYLSDAISASAEIVPVPSPAATAPAVVKTAEALPASAVRRLVDKKFKYDTTSQQGRIYQWLSRNPKGGSKFMITRELVKAGFTCNQDPERAVGYYLNEWVKKGWATKSYGGTYVLVD